MVFLEPKRVYRAIKMEVPEEQYVIPLGTAKVVREGTDLTLISWGAHVRTCREAAERMAAENRYDVEVVDLRTLSPCDWRDRGRERGQDRPGAIVVTRRRAPAGFGAEIIGAAHGAGHACASKPRSSG